MEGFNLSQITKSLEDSVIEHGISFEGRALNLATLAEGNCVFFYYFIYLRLPIINNKYTRICSIVKFYVRFSIIYFSFTLILKRESFIFSLAYLARQVIFTTYTYYICPSSVRIIIPKSNFI